MWWSIGNEHATFRVNMQNRKGRAKAWQTVSMIISCDFEAGGAVVMRILYQFSNTFAFLSFLMSTSFGCTSSCGILLALYVCWWSSCFHYGRQGSVIEVHILTPRTFSDVWARWSTGSASYKRGRGFQRSMLGSLKVPLQKPLVGRLWLKEVLVLMAVIYAAHLPLLCVHSLSSALKLQFILTLPFTT